MTLLSTIKTDALAARKDAMLTKSADAIARSNLLSTLLGRLETDAKNFKTPRDLTDQEILAVIGQFLKANALSQEKVTGLPADRVAVESAKLAVERAVLESYRPSMMSEDEIAAFAEEKKAAGLNFGAVMGALKAERTGLYDGRLASTVVKKVFE